MLQLYNEKPVLISMKKNKSVFNVEFCNIKMKLKMCQFKLFHNYLMNTSENLTSDTHKVDLLLVRDNLNVTVSIDDFLELWNGVQSVMATEFGFTRYRHQT